MNSSSVIFGVWVLFIAIGNVGYCDTVAFQPGTSYSWIIPPQNQPNQDRPALTFDPRNESPITHIGGFGHPKFYLRHSHEQLNLPNEFLVTSNDPQRESGDGRGLPPNFQQLDPVDCDGGPNCPNVDITEQQRPTTIHQSNIASVPAITSPPLDYQQRSSPPAASLGQPVSWPSSHGGGIGLLFFVPESASHLPVEQLIRQQLALHRTKFPFDISINCEDAAGYGCRPDGGRTGTGGGGFSLPLPLFLPATTSLNGRNSGNGNYASLPLVEIDNSSSRRGVSHRHHEQQQRKWRTVGERLVRNNRQYENRLHQLQQLQQQQQQQLQQNQRELSIYP